MVQLYNRINSTCNGKTTKPTVNSVFANLPLSAIAVLSLESGSGSLSGIQEWTQRTSGRSGDTVLQKLKVFEKYKFLSYSDKIVQFDAI